MRFIAGIIALLALVACSEKPAIVPGGEGTDRGLVADVLDLVFNSDGTATDKSAMHNVVTNNSSMTMTATYSYDFNNYICHYDNDFGTSVGSGYHRISYYGDTSLRNALQESFSIELLFSCDALPGKRCSVFSSLQEGGFGVGLGKDSKIQFRLCTPSEQVLDSGLLPEPGYLYHVVAVYDRENLKAALYVDGECVATRDLDAPMALPTAETGSWICCGGDCSSSKNYAEETWKGAVALARIYGKVLSKAEVGKRYAEIDIEQAVGSISINRLAFLNNCTVRNGGTYYVYGEGFTSADTFALIGVSGNKKRFSCESLHGNDHVKLIIPDNFVSGWYNLIVTRKDYEKVLGRVMLTLGDAVSAVNTKIFAHRCVHNNSKGPYENTLAALRKTQTYGVYGAEFDVWMTTDGYLVVHHDSNLGGKVIQNSTYAQIKDFKLPLGDPLPLFEDFLDEGKKYPECILNFEIKKHNSDQKNIRCAEAVAAMLKEKGMVSQCRVMSYSTLALEKLIVKFPELKVDALGDVDPSTLIGKGYSGISVDMNTLSSHPEWISTAHENGMQVTTWTPSTVADMMTFINLGVDFMTVNSVDMAKSVIQRIYVE